MRAVAIQRKIGNAELSDRPAIVQATYANWKPVPSRKVLQLVFEVPIERQGDVLGILGAPGIDTADWYAIAKMAVTKVGANGADNHPAVKSNQANASIPEVAPEGLREKKRFSELKRAAQAALKCQDGEFQIWLCQVYRPQFGRCWPDKIDDHAQRTELVLKEALGITSKTELDSDPAAGERWDRLLTSFTYKDRVS